MNTLSGIVNLSSVSCLKELTEAQIQALQSMGITRISDLLHFDPINNAKMLMSLVKDEIVIDLNKANILDDAFKDTPLSRISSLPIKALKGIGDPFAKIFKESFSIITIEQLAVFKPYSDAENIILKHSNEFSEPSSAPEALIPKIVGSVASQYSYSNFIKEKRLRFNDLELVYDDQRLYVDHRLIALFIATNYGNSKALKGVVAGAKKIENRTDSFQIPEVQVGYISKLTQKWINYGTHLGEVIHSLPLAPGESRNIAVIDWKRKQSSARKEDTKASEQLTNDLFHKRALDEVTRSAAAEHQQGGTDISAATIATAAAGVAGAALVGGVAGALPGAAIGALVGLPAGGVGAVPGALIGAGIGFGVGAAAGVGVAVTGVAAAQMGTIHSDSSGDRGINARLSQDIEDSIKQKSSSIRSLWSSVIVTDEQAENENLTTRNVTNYNHSHALTIQYFEVLQHYKSEMCMTQAEPFLLLPFAPLEFNFDLIVDFWSILKFGVHDVNLLKDFDNLVNAIDDSANGKGIVNLEHIAIWIQRPTTLNSDFFGFSTIPPAKVNLLGVGNVASKEVTQGMAPFAFHDGIEAGNFRGIQVENLKSNERVLINIIARMADEDNKRILKRINLTEFFADENGLINFNFSLVESSLSNPENRTRNVEEIEKYFNAHRYRFTRMLLLAIEKEQLIDVVESLILRSANPALNKLIKTARGENYFTGDVKDKYNSNESGGSFSKSFMDFMRRTILSMLTDIIKKYEPLTILTIPRAAVLDSIHTLLIQVGEFISEISENQPKSDNEKKKITEEILKLTGAWFSKFTVFAKEKKQFEVELTSRIAKVFASLDKFDSYDNFIHLSEFIDSTPFAITGNTIMFKMKKIVDKEVLANPLINNNSRIKELKEYPEDISNYLNSVLENKSAHTLSSDIYLPTSGVFAEAILGRSNASEKIDITRYINWQDMPIPHHAPAINALSAGQHNVAQQDLAPTVPAGVLNIMNPPALPDPTGMAGVLNAIQNGNIFRDMSKSDQLVTVMGNLSNLAQSMAQQAGSLAGQAQSDALKAATEIGKQVAQLASQAASQSPNAPRSFTEKGGAANSLEKLISGQGNGGTAQIPDEFKSILGIGGNKGNNAQSPLNSLPFLNEKKDIADLIGDFSKSGIDELKLNNEGGNIEFRKRASFLTSNDPNFSSTERDGTVNTPVLTEREQIQSIVASAANSADGSVSVKDRIEIVRLLKADFEKNIKPNVKAKAGDFSLLKCELTKLISWQADVQLFGLSDELQATDAEATQLARESMKISLANAIERAKNNNNIGQIETAIKIAADAQLLGFDDAAFDVSNIIASLNLSFIVDSSFDSTITDGQGKSLEVRVLLKIDANSGAPMAGVSLGISVEGGSAQPSTGSSNNDGIFNCTVTCTDRSNLRISGLVALLGLDSLQANFEVL